MLDDTISVRSLSEDGTWNTGSVQDFSNLALVPDRNRSIKFRSLMKLLPLVTKIIMEPGVKESKDVIFLVLLALHSLLEIIKETPTIAEIKEK